MKNLQWALSTIIAFFLVFGYLPPDAEAESTYHIEVDKKANQLFLYKNGVVQKVYPVATGHSPELTPEGTFTLVTKFIKPGWKSIPGGVPENPLGERWLGIRVNGDQGRTYGIHGTNDPTSIGKHISNGCIRMQNQDVIELYRIVPEGTPVQIYSKGTIKKKETKVQEPYHITIRASRANVRSTPSLQAPISQIAYAGSNFTVTGKVGDWFQVKLLNGNVAYIHTSVADITSTKNITSSNGLVKVPLANIRSNPFLEAPVLERVAYGTPLKVSDRVDGWYKIKMKGGKVGYIYHDLLHPS